jgi:hypothetical protein
LGLPGGDSVSEDDAFYDTYLAPLESRLLRTAWRITRDPDRARDALQDAVARIWKQRHQVRTHPNPRALVLRIGIQAAIDVRRREGRWWLVTIGGALALALYLRTIGLGASVVVGLGAAGTVATLLGLTRSLQGFATVSITEVAGGLMFAISSGYAALAGLAAVGLPLLDHDAREGRQASAAARWAAYGFPLAVMAVLVLAVALVMIPMEKPAG